MKKLSIIFLILFFVTQTKPPALKNCGNSCYLNAVIQALYSLQPLTFEFLQNPNIYSPMSIAHDYTSLINAFRFSKYEVELQTFVFKTRAMLQRLAKGGFAGQQDAAEFMQEFLFELQEHKNIVHQQTNPQLHALGLQFTRNIHTLITQIVESKIGCPNNTGNIAWTKIPDEEFSIVTLLIQPQSNSLNQLINNLFEEEIEYNNKQCIRQRSWKTAPELMFFSLNRYYFDKELMQTRKINNLINIPLNLDIAQWNLNKQSSLYELRAAIVHQGGAAEGHYIAYVKDLESNIWYLCDDERITPKTAQEVQKSIQAGYIFCYQKSSMAIEKPSQIVQSIQEPQIIERGFAESEPSFKELHRIPSERERQPRPISLRNNLEKISESLQQLTQQLRMQRR